MTRILAAALSLFITASAALISTVAGVEAKTLGIVALIANDALNVAVIAGATDAAKAAGWDVKVIDTQASADQANAGMSSFAVQKVDAIMVLAFASSSIGSGLAAANAAGIPVASWGGEIVPGIIVTTSGQTGADRAAGEGEDHDRIDFLHGERAHARVRLIRARLGVDHFNVPTGGLRGVGRAGDHGDVKSIVGDQGDNAERLRFDPCDGGDQRR